ncbi:MAG TPA: hypothetical protein DIU15_10760 [Deltaproteobacteria bacterium]|nr:hypothetical protein [Deltaproteobacteria bacterium]HCP46517.1 hypothetical protein [Deltaproteobacteria bacterium]
MLLFAGCRSHDTEPADSEPEPELAEAASHVQEESSLPAEGEAELEPAIEGAEGPAGGPVVYFKPDGLSPTYENYTGDPSVIHRLRANLKGRVAGDTLVLKAHWDERHKHGTFTLHLPEADTRWDSLSKKVKDGGTLDLGTVQPVLAALGAYRADLGARFDLRLLAFDIRLSWWDKRSGSHCTLSGVANDPDGETPSRCFKCVDFRVGIHEICRTETSWPSTVEGPKKGLKMLSSALRSTPP